MYVCVYTYRFIVICSPGDMRLNNLRDPRLFLGCLFHIFESFWLHKPCSISMWERVETWVTFPWMIINP